MKEKLEYILSSLLAYTLVTFILILTIGIPVLSLIALIKYLFG